jgi:hypothetical protein
MFPGYTLPQLEAWLAQPSLTEATRAKIQGEVDLRRSEQTISQRLAGLGYLHRRDAKSSTDYRHVITRVSDGEEIGRMDAAQAVAFIKTQEKETP